MSEAVRQVGENCCGDRYRCDATHKCSCCGVAFCIGCYQEHCQTQFERQFDGGRSGFVAWPASEPARHNACTDPCDMWTGPCACGAWHKEGK